MSISNFKIRKFLYFTLFGLITVLLVTICSYSVNQQITDKNTWQYNATYDFDIKVEENKDGELSPIIGVSNAEEFAGAMNLLSKPNIYKKEVKDGPVLFKSLSDITINNGTVVLYKNLDLGNGYWSPSDFSGTLDGQGLIIKNFKAERSYSNLGLVQTNSGTIKNIIFENATVKNTYSGSANTGVIAGTNNGTITNISILGNSSVKGNSSYRSGSHTGGLVGYNNGTLTKCLTYANVDYGQYIGGIVGYARNGSVQYCINHGNVWDNNAPEINAGGITGYIYNGTLEYCENTGNVTGATSMDEYAYVGGVVGYADMDVSKCGNRGDVSGGDSYASTAYTGGVAGFCTSYSITDCYNTGTISSRSKRHDSKNEVRFGRIKYADYGRYSLQVGDDRRSEASYGSYQGSGNKSYFSKYEYRAYAGGVVGGSRSISITRCYNTGGITDINVSSGKIDQWAKWIAYHDRLWPASDRWESVIRWHTVVDFEYRYTYSTICPSSSASISQCYHSTNILTSRGLSISISQDYYVQGSYVSNNYSSSWSDTTYNSSWYFKSGKGLTFYTTFGVDPSSYSQLHMKARIKDGSPVTYKTYNIGASGSTHYCPNTGGCYSSASSIPLSSGSWTKTSGMYGGTPYIVGMYW